MERWTWDNNARTGYVHIRSDLGEGRTVVVHDSLLVDVDPAGRIRGIEVLDADDPQDMITRLAAVLEHCTIVE